MPAPEVYGPDDAELTLIGWGSTYGPLVEAVDILGEEGHSVNLVHFTHIHPLPVEKAKAILGRPGMKVCVENNRTGQFARLLMVEAGIEMVDSVLRYDGLPFTPQFIVDSIKQKEVL